MIVPGGVTTPGQVVTVMGGVYRGRVGSVAGTAMDGSIRVKLDRRSAYDAERPVEFAWIPVDFLTVRG